MDHDAAPVLEAPARYQKAGELSFAPPGHKQARGADPRVREVLGDAVFHGDVLASGGLDDRRTRGGVLQRAEQLMADAVHAEHPDARGALVTSPTPYGTCADLSGIAEVCHRRGRPVIVDEAWGAHLPFHPGLPTWAMDAGADVCVTSIHKMGSGLEQGSVFHLQGQHIDPAVLAQRSDLLGTTSPSVLIHAGMDGWRRQMALHGRELLGHALELAAEVRERLEAVAGVHVNGREDFTGEGRDVDLDPLPVVLDLSELPVTGYQAADWLRASTTTSTRTSATTAGSTPSSRTPTTRKRRARSPTP
jgi:arginine/lysine/ornithine decarboxylase